MKLEILLSCMNQKDLAIVEESHITGDVLIINQADDNLMKEISVNGQNIRMLTTTVRGLSRSRNMAMENANGDICIFCDNDEIFYHDYEKNIISAFLRLQDADIILFDFDKLPHKLKGPEHRLKKLELLHAISCQIAYRKKSLDQIPLRFHPFMGAGSGNGAQEENKFLLDCYKTGMKIYYVPIKIGEIKKTESTWFSGYNEKFFYQRGGSTRQMLGLPLSVLYAIYYTVFKRRMYEGEISFSKALVANLKGCFEDPIGKQMRNPRER